MHRLLPKGGDEVAVCGGAAAAGRHAGAGRDVWPADEQGRRAPPAHRIAGGHVAENISVWRSARVWPAMALQAGTERRGLKLGAQTLNMHTGWENTQAGKATYPQPHRMCGSKPRSSMRSASSSTR